jgi:flavin reductase (DIM6/NTAB) family NADH-FMN oxidoreductase RutF
MLEELDTAVGGGSRFKALMSTFPSGVAVVTTVDPAGTRMGLTCSALCSLSADPPLLLVCIHNRSQTLLAITARGLFAVNLLHERGQDAARLFASNVPDRFGGVRWRSTPRWQLPCLAADAHAVAECRVRTSVPGGDHTIVVGEVAAIHRLTDTPPLLYGLRQYAPWPAAPASEDDRR